MQSCCTAAAQTKENHDEAKKAKGVRVFVRDRYKASTRTLPLQRKDLGTVRPEGPDDSPWHGQQAVLLLHRESYGVLNHLRANSQRNKIHVSIPPRHCCKYYAECIQDCQGPPLLTLGTLRQAEAGRVASELLYETWESYVLLCV